MLQATSLFAISFLILWAVLGFHYTFVVALLCGVGTILLLLFNLGYCRWLNRKQQMDADSVD